MHRGDIVDRRGPPRPDRPDRLIGNRAPVRAHILGQRAFDLGGHHPLRFPRVTLLQRLADADDRLQSGAVQRFRLGGDQYIAFALVGAPLRMADDRETRARLDQHRRRQTAGIGAPIRRMDILRADRQRGDALRRPRDQRRGHRHGNIDIGMHGGGGGDTIQLRQGGTIAVHLPIACHQLTSRHAAVPPDRRGRGHSGDRDSSLPA